MAFPPLLGSITASLVIYLLSTAVHADYQENLLNVPQILLPFVPKGSTPTNFTLRAMKGCFKWTSTRPEVAVVNPIVWKKKPGSADNVECARSAVVTAQSSSLSKESTVIIAEEEVTGLTLRCDVFVDVIARIQIATTTRELFLGENPEVFEVYGYDEEGNLFTTLGRITFRWYLTPTGGDDSPDPNTILKFLWFKESPYETSVEIYDVESKGQRGFNILVEGINTGEAIVSAKLDHPFYTETLPSSVKLTVIDNIILLPSSDSYILIGTAVTYRVMQLRRGKQKEIRMPSNQYQLSVTNTSIATLDSATSKVTGVTMGTTRVVLFDKNMANTKLVRQPTSNIHVVQPAKLTFSIQPGNVWILETGREYIIRVHIYDRNQHEILITDNIILTSTLSSKYFELKSKTLNESYLVTKTLKSGIVSIYSLLSGVKETTGESLLGMVLGVVEITDVVEVINLPFSLRGEQDVLICDPIIVTPALSVIPWDPSLPPDRPYQIELKASGGCGSYIWSSANDRIASVNNKGFVTSNNVIGSSEIKATDSKNTAHSSLAKVYVLPPDEMDFTPGKVEAQLGSRLFLYLSLAAYADRERVVYKDCSHLKLDIAFSTTQIFKLVDEYEEELKVPEGACTGIVVDAVGVGFTKVTASYAASNGSRLKASITVGAYPPLKVVRNIPNQHTPPSHPLNHQRRVGSYKLGNFLNTILSIELDLVCIVPRTCNGVLVNVAVDVADPLDSATVTLASTRDIVLQGGPQPWILDMSGYFEQMSSEEEEWVSISLTRKSARGGDREGGLHVFRVLCKQLGEQMLTVQVGNRPTAKNIKPASSVLTVRYSCQSPASVKLKPVIKLPTIDGHQLTTENCQDADKQIPVRNARELSISLTVRDASGTAISNASSLDVKWFSSDSNLARLLGKQYPVDQSSDIVTAYQLVSLANREGPVTISVKITHYQKIYLYAAGVFKEVDVSPPISGSLNLLLVPESVLSPSSLILWNHPENKIFLKILGGSHFYVIKESNTNLAFVQKTGEKELLVSPTGLGNLIITIHDACLDARRPARASINLEAIHRINLVVPDKVELTKSIKAIVQVYDVHENPLNVVDMNLLGLFSKLSHDIIRIKPIEEGAKKYLRNRAVYDLTGLAVGVTSLTFHIKDPYGIDLSSHPEDIQVFPPLRLNPRYLVLLPGATFQVLSHGGPRPQSTTVFSIQNETVANVNTAGLVTAFQPGVSGLAGMAQGSDPHTGQNIVYSQDEITVDVIQIKGFKIFVPSRNLVSGSQIGIYAVGISDEGPFTFASSPPYLQFHWSSSNLDVATLKSVYAQTGVTVESERDFRVVLHSLNPGQTAIRMRVEVANGHENRIHPKAVLEDDVQIQVFEELKLVFPENGQLLLPHSVATKIRTNRDGLARLTYKTIVGCSSTPSDPVIYISSNGEVNSLTSSGNVALLITSHEDFGFNQSVVIHIEVRPIASISLRSLSMARASLDKMHAFPLGTTVEFGVSLHDNVGRKFDVTNVPIEHRIHRLDSINVIRGIDNGTFSIKMASIGEAILKVYYKNNPQIADYVRIRVDHAIFPSPCVTQLGAVACFHLKAKCSGCKKGSWHSSNPQLLSVDAETGVAVANAVGSAVVYYSVPTVVTTYAEVTIRDTYSIYLSSDYSILSNLVFSGRPSYAFEVAFEGEDVSPQTCNGSFSSGNSLLKSTTNLPMECSLASDHLSESGILVTDIFRIEPKYISGKLLCEVIGKDLSAQALQPFFAEDTFVLIQATLRDLQRETEITSNIVRLRFVPAFILSPNALTVLSLKTKEVVAVTGSEEHLHNLEVLIENPSLLQVNKMREDLRTKDMYEVTLPPDISSKSYTSTPLSIVFKSRITGQTEEVNVYVQLPAEPLTSESPVNCTAPPAKTNDRMSQIFLILSESATWLFGFTVMLATMILLLFCYHNFTTRNREKFPLYHYDTTPPPPYQTPGTQFRTAGGSPPPYHHSSAGSTPPRTLFSVSQ